MSVTFKFFGGNGAARVRATLALCTVLLTGCGTLYLAQAASGQVGVMRARRPIDKVVVDPKTPAELRTRLLDVRSARNFAKSCLRSELASAKNRVNADRSAPHFNPATAT